MHLENALPGRHFLILTEQPRLIYISLACLLQRSRFIVAFSCRAFLHGFFNITADICTSASQLVKCKLSLQTLNTIFWGFFKISKKFFLDSCAFNQIGRGNNILRCQEDFCNWTVLRRVSETERSWTDFFDEQIRRNYLPDPATLFGCLVCVSASISDYLQ